MSGGNEMARNLLEQEPGRGRGFGRVSHPTRIADHGADCHKQETSEGCGNVIAFLDRQHRAVACKGRIRWIMQRRKNSGAERPWCALGYFCTKVALIRVCASSCAQFDAAARVILLALPDVIGGAE